MRGPKGRPMMVCLCQKPSGFPLLVRQVGSEVIAGMKEGNKTWSVKQHRVTTERITGYCPNCNGFFDLRLKPIEQLHTAIRAEFHSEPDQVNISLENIIGGENRAEFVDVVRGNVQFVTTGTFPLEHSPYRITLPSASGPQELHATTIARHLFSEALRESDAMKKIAATIAWDPQGTDGQFVAWKERIRQEYLHRYILRKRVEK